MLNIVRPAIQVRLFCPSFIYISTRKYSKPPPKRNLSAPLSATKKVPPYEKSSLAEKKSKLGQSNIPSKNLIKNTSTSKPPPSRVTSPKTSTIPPAQLLRSHPIRPSTPIPPIPPAKRKSSEPQLPQKYRSKTPVSPQNSPPPSASRPSPLPASPPPSRTRLTPRNFTRTTSPNPPNVTLPTHSIKIAKSNKSTTSISGTNPTSSTSSEDLFAPSNSSSPSPSPLPELTDSTTDSSSNDTKKRKAKKIKPAKTPVENTANNEETKIPKPRKTTSTSKKKHPEIRRALPELPPFPPFLQDNPKFQICSLAETCEKLILGREYILEPKIDGVRVITYVKDGKYRMFSRTAKEYMFFNYKFVDEIQNICKKLQEKYPGEWKEFIIDGEMLTNNKEFNSVVGLGHSKNMNSEGMKYYVFDIVKLEDYLHTKKAEQLARKHVLQSLFDGEKPEVEGEETYNRVVALPFELVKIENKEKLLELTMQYVRDGYEGIMLKDPTSPYYRKRHSGLLKSKLTNTYDLKIVRVIEGQGRYKDSMGALELQSANKREVNVGSGFSDAQRRDLWKLREHLIGKIVEISAQELTKNSLRFPVFIKIREDKTEPDVI